MATHTLQPSEYDIQREVEALRDIRRRSTTPGALTIDPDLPNQSPPSSPTYRSPSGDSSADGHPSDTSGGSSSSASSSRTAVDNPFSLFWVPASAHPEINHNAFRAFLKEHAKSPPPTEDEAAPQPTSSLSPSSGSLSRRKSMLSRQYRPEDHDSSSENEEIIPLQRTRSLATANRGPQLTINELQKLEELAEQAAESGDPSKFTHMLRRSLSMKMGPAEGTADVAPLDDEADAPILVPPSGQPLRRAARTKIRKVGLPGDGGGHRFGASRRKGPPQRAGTMGVERTSSDRSSDDHAESLESPTALRRQTISDDGMGRPESFSEVFDAYYTRDEEEDAGMPILSISPPPVEEAEPPEDRSKSKSPVQPTLLEALGPVLHHPQPSKPSAPTPAEQPPSPLPSPTPSDLSTSTADHSPPPPPPHVQQPPSFLSTAPSPPSKKEKDKKGLFSKWGSDKSSKKAVKDKERDGEARERAEKEKESGFFGSIFGGSKKKQDDQPPPLLSPGASNQAAQSLLGSGKNKAFIAPGATGLSPGAGVNFYTRYPIHVERAIYRLSHIKLANPRRPLYEQVLISNLMFWYLGVINKAQAQNAAQNGQVAGGNPGQGQGTVPDQAEIEKAQREREQRERAERERQEKEQREREEAMKKKESGKRGSLVKNTGGQGGGRRAEIPVKGPSYEMQHRVMEQEYAGYNMQNQQGMQMNRSSSAPPGNGQYQRNNAQGYPQQQQSGQGEFYYASSDGKPQQSQQGRLPPGAMAPDQPTRQHNMMGSGGSQSSSRGQQSLGSSRYHTSQENLSLDANGNDRAVTRSLSATALPSQPSAQANGRSRKGQSAHAAIPGQGRRPRSREEKPDANGTGEEDIPLAMWQQQRRR